MVFILECRRAKVDEPNVGAQQDSPLWCLSRRSCAGRWDNAVVGERLVRSIAEKYVLGFQIGMDESQIM